MKKVTVAVSQAALLMRVRGFWKRQRLNFRRSTSKADRARFGSWFVVDPQGRVIQSAGPGVEESLSDLAIRLQLVNPWEVDG